MGGGMERILSARGVLAAVRRASSRHHTRGGRVTRPRAGNVAEGVRQRGCLGAPKQRGLGCNVRGGGSRQPRLSQVSAAGRCAKIQGGGGGACRCMPPGRCALQAGAALCHPQALPTPWRSAQATSTMSPTEARLVAPPHPTPAHIRWEACAASPASP